MLRILDSGHTSANWKKNPGLFSGYIKPFSLHAVPKMLEPMVA
jgi:hypothetical protein